jgi:guanylate kinase
MQGKIFVLVGPGGVGKNTLMQMILPRLDNLSQLATATTRLRRPYELEGREHLFMALEDFQALIESDGLVEYTEVHPGKYYGVPRAPLEAAFSEGQDLIADIEIAGAARIKAAYPDNSVLVFIAPPSIDVLEARMRDRGEDEKGIQDRLNRTDSEMAFRGECDMVIVNDDREVAAQELYAYIATERELRARQTIN